ncbi:MAG: choice-of-anchor V domain-containing protein [Bacteroidota bacterium]
MKKLFPVLFPVGLVAFVFIMAGFGGDELKNSSGAPAGYTNSPADGQNCTHCMGGSASAVTGWVTSDVPATGYLPGGTYTITVTATGSGKKGFEVSPQDLTGNLVGTLVAGSGNKLTGSGKYVTHSAAVSTNPAVWHLQWTAPAGGAGDVTFYASIAITQTVTKTTTLTINQSTVGFSDNPGKGWICYPNPAHGKMFVKCPAPQDAATRADLLSPGGTLIRNLEMSGLSPGENRYEIMLSQPAGVYLLRLSGKSGTEIRKIIIE